MSIRQTGADLFFLDVRLFKNGKQYRHRETFSGCRKNAERRYHTLKEELQTAAVHGQRSLTDTTFKHIIDYYLEHADIDSGSRHYLMTLKSDLGEVQLSDLRDKFDRYLLLLKKTKVRYTNRYLSNATINRYMAWGKAAVNCALRAGLIEKNPLQHFQKLSTHPRDRMLNDAEKIRLIDAVRKDAPYIFPIMLFSLLIPSRRGELSTLKRTDYDMVNNVVIIPAERTKMKRPCIKPVPDCLVNYMRNVPKESEWLFYRKRGARYLPIGNFRKAWMKCLKTAGIKNYRFHDQRRGAYTDLLLKGNAPHIVMQVSGHATDMSKVYFGRNEMNAAKSIDFKEIGTLTGTLEGSETMQTAMV
jgi:integrase